MAKDQQLDPNDPTSFTSYRAFLFHLYSLRKKRSSAYSYKKFAVDLGFPDSPIMHQIIKGERKLTEASAMRIVKALKLKAHQKNYLLALVEYNNASNVDDRQDALRSLLSVKSRASSSVLGKDAVEFFNHWYHAAIRELAALPEFEEDPNWIAKTLRPRISVDEARDSLNFLLRLGFLRREQSSGRIIQVDGSLLTDTSSEGLELASYTQSMIDLGKDAVVSFSPDERDVRTASVRLTSDQYHALPPRLFDAFPKSRSDITTL